MALFFCAAAGIEAKSADSRHSKQDPLKQQTTIDQRGTEQTPFVIQLLSAQQSRNDTQQSALKQSSQWGLSDIIAVTASVAAFLQFAALVITLWLMARTARRQLRAYVLPDTAGLFDGTNVTPPILERKNIPWVNLMFKNSGQTPAYKLKSWANIAVAEFIHEDSLIVPSLSSDDFSMPLGPGCTFPKSMWHGHALSDSEIADLQNGKRAIYVYGRIEYVDVYGKSHFSNFRLAYAGVYPPNAGHGFVVCRKGNEASQ